MRCRLFFVMFFGLLAACDTLNNPAVPDSNMLPTVELTADSVGGTAPLVVTFTTTASDPDGDDLRYTLSFGDGQSVDTQNAAHTYRQAGTYTATVTVDDGRGGSASDTLTIEVTGSGDDSGDDDGSDEPPQACTHPVQIPDEVLSLIIRNALGKSGEELTCADLESFTVLRYSPDSGGDGTEPTLPIQDLSGLQYATSLRELYLTDNLIADVTPLGGLTKLEQLHLSRNNIRSLTPLSTLVDLRHLRVGANDITSVTPLADLVKLETLELSQNSLTDLTPLQNLVALEALDISSSNAGDLTPLSTLTQLRFLAAADNTFTTLEGLQSLTKLQDLMVAENTLDGISQLRGLVNLDTLNLRDTGISDVAPLQPLAKLYTLNLSENRISDITPLVDNPGLGAEDFVEIGQNDLDTCPGTKGLADIQALEARGAVVLYDACGQ